MNVDFALINFIRDLDYRRCGLNSFQYNHRNVKDILIDALYNIIIISSSNNNYL